jgi:hypothetical protein
VNEHILASTQIEFDTINYHGDSPPVSMPESFDTPDDIANGFRALTAPGTAFIRRHNEYAVNVLWVRVRDYEGEEHLFSIVVNRWHDNVAFFYGEDGALDASKDRADFIRGFVGSYPNYFFDVHKEDLPDFFDLVANFDKSPEDMARVAKYGINRADEKLWDTYDWFQERFIRDEPVKSGLFDLNRYFYEAL